MQTVLDAFGKNGQSRGNVRAKASLWDQAFDEVYRNVIQQEKPKEENLESDEIEDAIDVSAAIDAATVAASSTTTITTTTSSAKMGEVALPDNADKPSQLELPLRSSPMNMDCENSLDTTATSTCGAVGQQTGAIPKQYGSNSVTTSSFSGSVNRFLETRSKNFPSTKSFNIKSGNEKFPFFNKVEVERDPFDLPSSIERKGFMLSGTGAMFLKSRRHLDIATVPSVSCSVVVEGEVGTPPGYKSILRETGLAEVKRRWQREFVKNDQRDEAPETDDKKNVRFNLEDLKIPSSSEEELNAEMSSESDDGDIDDNEDPWGDEVEDLDTFEDLDHDDEEVNACVGIGTLPMDGANFQHSSNPFLFNDERQLKNVQAVAASKNHTSEMLKSQSFSMHIQKKSKITDSPKFHNGENQNDLNASGVQYLEKVDDSVVVKPLYDDTDSDSKGSSVRSIVATKPEKLLAHSPSNNPFEMDDLDQKPSHAGELLEKKPQEIRAREKPTVRSFRVASKLVGFLKRDNERFGHDRDSDDNSFETETEPPVRLLEDGYESECPINNPFGFEDLSRKHFRDVDQVEKKLRVHKSEKSSMRSFRVASKLVNLLKKDSDKAPPELPNDLDTNDNSLEALRESLDKEKQLRLKEERDKLEEQLQLEINTIKKEHEEKLTSIRNEYDQRLTAHRKEIEDALELQLADQRRQMQDEYDSKRKAVVDEHKVQMAVVQKNHAELLEELERDLKSEGEMIRKEHAAKLEQMKDKLNDELEAEKQRMKESGEERLYEKVRCEKRLLEDKYRCLKDKYARLKTEVKLSVERRNRRREAQALQQKNLHTTTTGSETERSTSHRPSTGNSENRCSSVQNNGQSTKPPVPTKSHLVTANKDQSATIDRSSERAVTSSTRKTGVSPKYARHLRVQDDTTSVSQSDTTISNTYPKGRHLLGHSMPHSDNGNSDSEAFASNVENNNNSRRGSGVGPPPQRKKQFTRLKSASTSRLNADNIKNERPCTPVENLRHQLQKLEDLEDQFPDNALDTTYHLRYPFSDISNADYAAGSSSELEFFKHRIHLERDSVRRAKESLRSQRTTFRARQREIKQRHNTMATRHSLEQLIQEEKDLTEMEVTLHRTRALLGEKVIRLRHLEQSVMRVCDKGKTPVDLLSVEPKEDATLSDLSSQSSSGFSSTDLASGDTQNLNKRREFHNLESNECIKNLEILNAEIREILDLLGRGGQHTGEWDRYYY